MSSKTKWKLVVFIVAALLTWGFNILWVDAVSPVVGADLAIANVNGGNTEWQAINVFQKHKDLIHGVSVVLIAVIALVLFVPRTNKTGKTVAICLVFLGLMSSGGCRKPYDKPEYIEIKTSETGFLVKLEGDTKEGQAKFNSADFLESHKVATKRVQITHRWNQTGRWGYEGEWIPMERLINVDRSPVTREWESKDGKSKGSDKAIWIESADSVGFSMGWSCSSFIMEEDAAQFLYMYTSGSLADVMDTEVRARIQQAAALVAAKYKLDELRDKKAEIASAVKEDITPFFKKRGITITTIGMFGGMTYENDQIQKAIDQTFISQQEKVNAKAMLDAQADKNTRITSEADALAEAARKKAKGEADGNLSKAQAEAKGIEAVNEAIAKANNNPMLIQLKAIEVEKARVAAWKGDYPTTVVGGDAKTWVGLGAIQPAAVTVPPASK